MMIDRNAKEVTYGAQLAILLGLTAAGIVISSFASVGIWLIMEGTSIPLKTEDMLQPRYYNVLMVLQGVSTFFVFFLPAYIFALLCYRNPAKFLGFNLHINYRQVLLVLLILAPTLPLSFALGELTKMLPIPESWAGKFKAMEAAREAQEATLIQINSFAKYILSLFIIALLPAIFEETFFRAGMQNLFTRWFKSPWTAIMVTSIIFSLIHFSFYGFFVRFALGIILGFIFYYSGSLWLSVLFHFLYNGLQVTILYLMNGTGVKEVNDLERNFPVWVGAPMLLLVLYLFEKYKQISISQQEKYPVEQVAENDFNDWANNQPKL